MTLRRQLRAVLTAGFFFHALSVFAAGQAPEKATIQGVVHLARTGDPASGARVTLFAQTTAVLGPRETPPVLASGETDGNGAFLFPGLEPGSFRLTVGLNGYVRYESSVTLAAGQRKDDV